MLNPRRKQILFNNNNKPKYVYSVWAKQWKAYILANGHTIDNSNLQAIDTYVFKPSLANGNIYNQLDRFNIYAGLDGHQGAARCCTIRGVDITRVNSPHFDNFGYRSVTNGYLNLQYKLFTNGVKFQKNNNSFGVLVKDPMFLVNFLRMIGSRDITSSGISALIRGTASLLNANSTNTFSTIPATTLTGWNLLASIRNNSTNYKSIINNSETTINTSSGGSDVNDLSVYELTINGVGTPDGQYDTINHGASFHGSASLDVQALSTFLKNYFIAIGV
jgi:hypothetical protein